jgi:vitamin K-dependent gamma-carboxylase
VPAVHRAYRICVHLCSSVVLDFFRPVDIASAVAFRIAVGLLMLAAIARYFAYGWITQLYVTPRIFFPYPGLEWIVPLPGAAMYALFVMLGVLAVCVAIGLWYRASVALLCLGFTYVHLLDRTNYLNHYYLLSLLSGLMIFLPLHGAASLDAWRRPVLRSATVPAWVVWLLRFQLGVVYVFGAVAKLNADWLLRGQPLRIWLGANVDLPLLGPWLEAPWAAYVCSYAGLAFDASIVPLLLWRRTRTAAFIAVLIFHAFTALLFPIGMFPWIMIALTPIFFPPDWPRRWLGGRRCAAPSACSTRSSPHAFDWLVAAGIAAYALVQIALPLRHLLYAGDLYWSESGMRFSWQIMVMEKYGRATFRVTDPRSGATWTINPGDSLTPLQVRMMATQPDMIRSFAEYLAAEFRARGYDRVEVHGDVYVSLNGRPHQRLVDPHVDLAHLGERGGPPRWIVPLRDRQPASSRAGTVVAHHPTRGESASPREQGGES